MLYVYGSEDAFFLHNPWFSSTIKHRIIESSALRLKIHEEVSEQFPSLFRQHALSDQTWAFMRSRMEEQTGVCISRINAATDTKVRELMAEEKEFKAMQERITSTALRRYDLFQSNLQQQAQAAEEERNRRLEAVERSQDKVRSNQVYTFLGGGLVGAALLAVVQACHGK